MAVILLLLFLLSFREAQAQLKNFNISHGSSLTPTSNSSWLSPSGLYAFGFYSEGDGFAVGIFIAGIPEKTVVWTANWDKDHVVPSNATLLLTTDGRLIVEAQGRDINVAYPEDSIASASMLDNGNFVLYRSDRNITWQSFDHPTDTLLPGQRLIGSANQEMFSRASETDYFKGIFRLKMQSDGNLVMYPINSPDTAQYAYYQTNTEKLGSLLTLNLQKDGLLYLFNSTQNIKNITQGGYPSQRIIYLMRLDVDGIFRVYSHSLDKGNWTVHWKSTDDGCVPKGICGLNEFCTLIDQEVSCRCLPGFELLIKGNQSSGCEANFTPMSCIEVNRSVEYSMRRLENTIWVNTLYSVLETISVEDCEQKCLEDCKCEVALYHEGECQKQKLPLQFGRRDPTVLNSALIKVGPQSSITNDFPTGNVKEKRNEVRKTLLIVSIALILLAVLILVMAGILFYRFRQLAYRRINKTRIGQINDDVSLLEFSYTELVQITNNFQEELGTGASGTVYKGIVPNSQIEVAVKKIEKELAEGEREFQTEMKVIAKTHHRNLVSLLGYCIDGLYRLLVYEFMCNGSLADVLFREEHRLNWTERAGIATDIVKGILYLHEECKTQIIHCDIKPQNILMDENMCAKIADFGLAKHLKQDQTRTYTEVRGTKGYVAPEWFRKLPVTVKVDVYSFGIVLLEIICHRRNVDWSLPEAETILDEWVYECYDSGEVSKLVQDEEVDLKKLERWVKVGIWCIQDEPSLRPTMRKVLLMLEGTVDVPIPPNPSSFLSSL